jgi:hypothetical protein
MRLPLPALENVRRDVDVRSQFLERLPAQEQAIEEGGFLPGFRESGVVQLHLV